REDEMSSAHQHRMDDMKREMETLLEGERRSKERLEQRLTMKFGDDMATALAQAEDKASKAQAQLAANEAQEIRRAEAREARYLERETELRAALDIERQDAIEQMKKDLAAHSAKVIAEADARVHRAKKDAQAETEQIQHKMDTLRNTNHVEAMATERELRSKYDTKETELRGQLASEVAGMGI
ncbi:hypothetical protein KIPB_011644, partial [Kipferlia bialata]